MMTKSDLCKILRSLVGNDVTVLPNRITNNGKKAIRVEDSQLLPELLAHGEQSFFRKCFKITIRYSEDEVETERFCKDLYYELKNLSGILINENSTWLLTQRITEPKGTGAVKNNIYEQSFEIAIIYN